MELMCNVTFKDEDPNKVTKYLVLLIEIAQNQVALSKTQPYISSGGCLQFLGDHDLQAKFVFLARKFEALEFNMSG